MKTLEQRFWEKVIKAPNSQCWKWISHKNSQGYGKIIFSYKAESAHRISWLLHFGPVPEGMWVCHKCDNPECTNPNHLFLGTRQDNITDMCNKNRQAHLPGIFSPRYGLKQSQSAKDAVSKANAKTYQLISPSGELVKIINLHKFCQSHDLDRRAIYRLFKNNPRWQSYHGWKIVNPVEQ